MQKLFPEKERSKQMINTETKKEFNQQEQRRTNIFNRKIAAYLLAQTPTEYL